MNRYVPIVAFAVAALWPEGWAHAAGAQQCGKHDEVVAQLGGEKYHETSHSVGLTSAGTLLEVFRSDDGATWSIVVTTPQGVSCLVAYGENWQDMPTAPTPTPTPQSDTKPGGAPSTGYPGVGQNAQLDPNKQFEIKF